MLLVAQTKAAPKPFRYAEVPKLCPGGTVVCVGGGPSLTKEDVEYCREKATVIAINDAYKLAPWAEVLYACDHRWWKWHKGVPEFQGLKYSLQRQSAQYKGVQILNNTGSDGLEKKTHGLRTGRNSGYQAINLALHLGARRVLLLGYDMQRTGGKSHWFGEHPIRSNSPLSSFRQHFDGLAKRLPEYGLDVINCSRETALTCFPRMTIHEALP